MPAKACTITVNGQKLFDEKGRKHLLTRLLSGEFSCYNPKCRCGDVQSIPSIDWFLRHNDQTIEEDHYTCKMCKESAEVIAFGKKYPNVRAACDATYPKDCKCAHCGDPVNESSWFNSIKHGRLAEPNAQYICQKCVASDTIMTYNTSEQNSINAKLRWEDREFRIEQMEKIHDINNFQKLIFHIKPELEDNWTHGKSLEEYRAQCNKLIEDYKNTHMLMDISQSKLANRIKEILAPKGLSADLYAEYICSKKFKISKDGRHHIFLVSLFGHEYDHAKVHCSVEEHAMLHYLLVLDNINKLIDENGLNRNILKCVQSLQMFYFCVKHESDIKKNFSTIFGY